MVLSEEMQALSISGDAEAIFWSAIEEEMNSGAWDYAWEKQVL